MTTPTPTSPTRPIAVLFDLDGTLIDSIALLLKSVHHAFEGFSGLVPTDAEWIQGIGTPLAKQLAVYARSDAEVKALNDRYRAFQREHHDQYTSLYSGTLEVLQTLYAGGHPMGVVTSKSNYMMDRALAFTDITKYMGTTIGSDSCTIHKPDPFPVHLALQELGYATDEAVFVGDSPHDMNAGNAAGVTTIAALWGPFTKDQLHPTNPTHYLESITALPSLVARIQNTKTV